MQNQSQCGKWVDVAMCQSNFIYKSRRWASLGLRVMVATSVLNHRPWKLCQVLGVLILGGVMMTMTRTRMTIICQALGWALFQLYYPLHPPMRGIVWPPFFLLETRKTPFTEGENARSSLGSGRADGWTQVCSLQNPTLSWTLDNLEPFPFRNELCCPASRIGLHSVPCRWLEPHIHAGWFTLYLRSHSFLIPRLVASHHCPLFAQCHADPRISSEGSLPLRVSSTTFAHARHLFITVHPFCLIASLQDPGPRFTFIYTFTSAKWFPGPVLVIGLWMMREIGILKWHVVVTGRKLCPSTPKLNLALKHHGAVTFRDSTEWKDSWIWFELDIKANRVVRHYVNKTVNSFGQVGWHLGWISGILAGENWTLLSFISFRSLKNLLLDLSAAPLLNSQSVLSGLEAEGQLDLLFHLWHFWG